MIILIAGATHAGKTLLAQRLLERYAYPYLSMDHLKMGLIRSGHCPLAAESDDAELTEYLWPIVREMIKTCVENGQHLVVEGCYIPFGWEEDFTAEYLRQICYVCLVLSKEYVRTRFCDILKFRNVVERRLPVEGPTVEELCAANRYNLAQCVARGYRYVLIDGEYDVGPDDVKR